MARLNGGTTSTMGAIVQVSRENLALAVLWALKEASSKAVGAGLGIGLTDVICEETAEGRHHVRIKDGPVLRARHLVHEGYVIALCLMREKK